MSVTMLKRIALLAMAVNYIGAFIPGMPIWFQWIGRLAAPLFFYGMAWSLDKTHDKRQYFKRLYMCSVLMALVNLLLSFAVQKTGLTTAVTNNIFATLFAGALFIEVLEYGRKHPKKRLRLWLIYGGWQIAFALIWAALYELAEVPYAILSLLSSLGGSALMCEGAFLYVLMGALFYYTKKEKGKLTAGYLLLCLVFFLNAAFGIWGKFFMLIGNDVLVAFMEITTGLVLWGASFRPILDVSHMLNNDFQWMMVIALPLLLACNGKRGQCKKYFYYIFYPAHVYLLWFLGVVILK
ncbi:MAG: hypothetical protein HFI24_02455 [Lachnospiraceae bacterium]|jgi:hypothetical protein|nr:hypothetical protein [Lachnospiraceae bacterium]MCI9383050.1 hypothetical protein [Lachnospiraceae bacterium]